MMQATTVLSLKLPVMMCLPVQFHFLTTSHYCAHSKSPLIREITRAPLMSAQRYCGADVLARYARMTGPRTFGLTHDYTWHVAAMEGNIKKG
jgi:hypothetical protein